MFKGFVKVRKKTENIHRFYRKEQTGLSLLDNRKMVYDNSEESIAALPFGMLHALILNRIRHIMLFLPKGIDPGFSGREYIIDNYSNPFQRKNEVGEFWNYTDLKKDFGVGSLLSIANDLSLPIINKLFKIVKEDLDVNI